MVILWCSNFEISSLIFGQFISLVVVYLSSWFMSEVVQRNLHLDGSLSFWTYFLYFESKLCLDLCLRKDMHILNWKLKVFCTTTIKRKFLIVFVCFITLGMNKEACFAIHYHKLLVVKHEGWCYYFLCLRLSPGWMIEFGIYFRLLPGWLSRIWNIRMLICNEIGIF